jgi:hypothetical protein
MTMTVTDNTRTVMMMIRNDVVCMWRWCFFSRTIFSPEKIEMFFSYSSQAATATRHLMAQEQQNRIRVDDRMEEYERITEEWNQRNEVQERQDRRSRLINNTDGYHTGNRIHHIRSIQMYDHAEWNELFGQENLDPVLREYAQASIDHAQDETHTLRFAGQTEVSMIMQENYRPCVHVAVFIVHLTPHRRFYDGHMIQKEFGEGSRTHQTINRLFDTNTRACVLQATEYNMLEYLANDDEALDLLHYCFIDDEFHTIRFSYVAPDPQANEDNDDDQGHYYVNPYANDEHRWHKCTEHEEERRQQLLIRHDAPNEGVVAIPPPPPVNDFAAIYFRNLELLNDENYYAREYPVDLPPMQRNIIQYIYDGDSDSEDDVVEELHAQG